MNFTNSFFSNFDDYMTPRSAWESIQEYIPKDKVIWEAFYGDGWSGRYLEDMGFRVIHQDMDFFTSNPEFDIIVSNPPFSLSKEVLKRLKELDKPFILILPVSKITTSYMRSLFKDDDNLQIIIPSKRIQFIKRGVVNNNRCNFDCFYYCYKMDLPKSIVWL